LTLANSIRISAVSYLNTKPFLHGLKLAALQGVKITVDIPSVCATKLLSGEADLGLVPVAIIPLLKEAHVLPGYCIGADGPVESVKLYSHVPLEEITEVLCDYQSRTSVLLARVLAKELWKISPGWIEGKTGYENEISGTTAGVIIGDRTFTLNGKFPYEYDLAGEWKKLTGLPFVFAAWVSNTKLPEEFGGEFSNAMELGLTHIDEVISAERQEFPGFDVENYLRSALKFRLDARATAGLKLFLEKIGQVQ
jgi:chorismate dehydratase